MGHEWVERGLGHAGEDLCLLEAMVCFRFFWCVLSEFCRSASPNLSRRGGKFCALGGCLRPQKEGPGGGSGKGAQTSGPLCKDSPLRAPPLRCAVQRTCGVGNNSNSKQDRQFIVIIFTVFCTIHPSTLCNTSPKHPPFPPSRTHPFYSYVWGLLSDIDRPLPGWGYLLVLGPTSTTCQRYSRFVADFGQPRMW